MVSSWAEPAQPSLPSTTQHFMESQGWHQSEPNPGEWACWTKEKATLAYGPWVLDTTGEVWRLGTERAFMSEMDDKAVLGLDKGESFTLTGSENARQELANLATTLSLHGTVWFNAGTSVEGRSIPAVQMGFGTNRTLFLGVFHGDEPTGEVALQRLIEYLQKSPSILDGRSVLICPVLNPDGLVAGTRENARGVDINRNLPAKNWTSEGKGQRYWGGSQPASEPETLAVMNLIDRYGPTKILSIHAPLHNVNYDGPAAKLAQSLSRLNGYPVEPDIGYPTPGSFGTYYGRERSLPVITLEFPEGTGHRLWIQNKAALLEAIRFD